MTTQCPSCGDHYTTYKDGATVAGYSTPVVEVDLPGELEVVGAHMETRVHFLDRKELTTRVALAAEYGWAVRQILVAGIIFVVVLERPYGWADDPTQQEELADLMDAKYGDTHG